MAKFRKNHGNPDDKTFSGGISAKKKFTLGRLVFFFVGIVLLIYFLSGVTAPTWDSPKSVDSFQQNLEIVDDLGDSIIVNFYPESTTGIVVEHKNYALSYSEEHEQAEWVAYKLTKENLRKTKVKREKFFRPDNAIQSKSAIHSDYTHSGYTRGHLAPAADMSFDLIAMKESFYMSNMSPQTKEMNGGIWRELEESVRDWAYDNEELIIITGPVLGKEHVIKKIGNNQVSVPDLFYKVVLDLRDPEKKGIAFLIPNARSEQKLSKYAVNIDQVEEVTGLNFFADYLDPDLEIKLESETDLSKWPFDPKRFIKRIKIWNNR